MNSTPQPLGRLCAEIARKYGFECDGLVPGSVAGGRVSVRFLANGSRRLEFDIDLSRQRARIEDFEVPYSSVSQVYSLAKDGPQVEQFSPFDDGPPWPTQLSVEEWAERILRYFLEHRSLGYVHRT